MIFAYNNGAFCRMALENNMYGWKNDEKWKFCADESEILSLVLLMSKTRKKLIFLYHLKACLGECHFLQRIFEKKA